METDLKHGPCYYCAENRPHIEFLETCVLVRPIKRKTTSDRICHISATKTVSFAVISCYLPWKTEQQRIKSAITFSFILNTPLTQPPPTTPSQSFHFPSSFLKRMWLSDSPFQETYFHSWLEFSTNTLTEVTKLTGLAWLNKINQ